MWARDEPTRVRRDSQRWALPVLISIHPGVSTRDYGLKGSCCDRVRWRDALEGVIGEWEGKSATGG